MNFQSLNEHQINAIKREGNVLLIACPGSGKTRVLIYKVIYELEKLENSKQKILAITFTNRAADEIKRRLYELNIDDSRLWTGTMHSFCLDWILRPYYCYSDRLKNGFVVADEYKSEHLMNTLKSKHHIPFWARISTKILKDGTLEETTYPELVNEYHSLLENEKVIDFDQILYFSYSLLKDYPKIKLTLNKIFNYICVDEYQDIQQLQYSILSEIIKCTDNSTNYFLVGDRDQAIYSSLGGIAKSFNEIKSEFGNRQLFQMELIGNYRSTQRIIDYYRNFQIDGTEIISLCNYSSENGIISFNDTIHMDELDEFIANIISTNLADGVQEKDICVIAPQWWLVIPMGRRLTRLLPDVNFDALGLSPLLRNQENIWFKLAKLFLVAPSPKMHSVRKRWANEYIHELESMQINLGILKDNKARNLLRKVNSISSDKINGLDYLEDCFLQFNDYIGISMVGNIKLSQQWEYFFDGSRERLANPQFEYAADILSFKKYFNHGKGVVVNSCHGIKGEEYTTVIAFGLLQGYLPNRNEIDPFRAAHNLLYVICSRAKKNLYLISERGRTIRGNPGLTTELLEQLDYEYD
ncbi:MAG: ATP-dependent helicase [Ignavibacteriaceae bacterium]|nr:ATP-dependent helicase [Ignavibacteriaceae bacterium]